MTSRSESLPGGLARRLEARIAKPQTEWEARPAGVLVPLLRKEGEWHVLFTRRTDGVDTHRGQVSFPGGMVEPEDLGPREAALREAYEEIGLRAEDIHVLGTLDSLLTVTQFHVTPVVATVPWPYQFRINPAEVASVFVIPLDWLSDPANLEVRQRPPLVPGPPVSVYYFQPYAGEVIWGVTARITLQLLQEVAALWEGGREGRSV